MEWKNILSLKKMEKSAELKSVNETKGKNESIPRRNLIHADDDVENGHIIITESSIERWLVHACRV